ncbi:MAG: CYTH domain-containing protein [bacterium]
MELERKFLVTEPTDKLLNLFNKRNKEITPIEQYYILLEGNKEMRIRKRTRNKDVVYTLTVKSGSGGMRDEITFNISESMYKYQKEKAIGYIFKERLEFDLPYGLKAEIDLFDDFIMIEVEFRSGHQYMEFEESVFKEIGLAENIREVTTDSKYKNKNLATRGM